MALNCFVRRLLAWLFGCHWYWQFLLACIQIKARTGYCPDLETKFENSPQLIARVGVGQIRDQPLFTMGLGFESCFKEHKLKFVERSWKFRLIKNYPLKFQARSYSSAFPGIFSPVNWVIMVPSKVIRPVEIDWNDSALLIEMQWGWISCRWRNLSQMIACCVFECIKFLIVQENETALIRDKYRHLTLCLRLIQPNLYCHLSSKRTQAHS